MSYKKKTIKFPSKKTHFESHNPIARLSYIEARRLREPIYQTLATELYEEGCRSAAKHLLCLAKKEQELYAAQYISNTLNKNRPLLMLLYENIKLAEKASRLDYMGGMPACLVFLCEALKLLLSNKESYGWLLREAYEIVIGIADEHGKKDILCSKIRSQLYCMYAMYKGRNTSAYSLQLTLEYFEKSLELCCGQNWPLQGVPDTGEHESQHEFVAVALTRRLLAYAETFALKDPEFGAHLANKAVIVIKEVQHRNNVLLCEAYLVQIRLLFESQKYNEAMINTTLAEQSIDNEVGTEHGRLTGELYLLKGRCYQALKQPTKALIKYKQSILIGKKFGLETLHGSTLVEMGKLYMHYAEGMSKAESCFDEARDIFDGINDKHRKQGAIYLLAKLEASKHFSDLMNSMKGSNEFCTLYKLRRWKTLIQPFWHASESAFVESSNLVGVNPFHDTISRSSIGSIYSSHMAISTSQVSDEMSPYCCLAEDEITVSDDNIFDSEDEIIHRLTATNTDDVRCLLSEPI